MMNTKVLAESLLLARIDCDFTCAGMEEQFRFNTVNGLENIPGGIALRHTAERLHGRVLQHDTVALHVDRPHSVRTRRNRYRLTRYNDRSARLRSQRELYAM